MKRIHELKWEIGLASALGIAVLFSGVKASPAFEQAYLSASAMTDPTPSQTQPQEPYAYTPTNPSQGNIDYPGLGTQTRTRRS